MDVTASADQTGDPSALYVIFSNLGSKTDRFTTTTTTYTARPIVGRQVREMKEEWNAIRFVPKVDVQATVLEAAVGYISGTKLVRLALYSNDDIFNTPSTALPGAEGTTTDLPDLGECCQLAKVKLAQPITLTAGTLYWLVASPDDTNGPDFNGAWQVSHLGELGTMFPPSQWNLVLSYWPAARVSGTRTQSLASRDAGNRGDPPAETKSNAGQATIFSNLNPLFPESYIPGTGSFIVGNMNAVFAEAWAALPFTPTANVRVKTISAAVDYLEPTDPEEVNLAIYSVNSPSFVFPARASR